MQRYVISSLLLLCFVFLSVVPVSAGRGDKETLLSINGNSYSVGDFKTWWNYWKEDDISFPQTPAPYIDWLLLSKEAELMDLTGAADFKHKTRVFLQARSLLKLQFEEVTRKAKPSEADIKKRYEERYLPRWLVQRLKFQDKEAAEAARLEFAKGAEAIEKLLELNPEQGGPLSKEDFWVRSNTVDRNWLEKFEKMSLGEMIDLTGMGMGTVIDYLKEKKGGDEEDFAKWRTEIEKDLQKEREVALTSKLLSRLRDKYDVEINEARLAAIDLKADPESFSDDLVITTSVQNVTEKQFMSIMRRVLDTRPKMTHQTMDKEEADKLKLETANNIIAQSVTNWESLDRHYEEKEPFKSEYEFNFRHRLSVALEERLFVPEAKVSDEEVRRYYEENQERYMQPPNAIAFIFDETQAPVDQIWAEAVSGKDFRDIVEEHLGEGVSPSLVPLNHLDPEVRGEIEKLSEGETSSVFSYNGRRTIAHLIKRNPSKRIPLQSIGPTIRKRLVEEKIQQLRSDYLEKLKSVSKIVVNDKQWKSIQKELGGA
ncbi:peptidyl-prolyl cis-trans isomerase [Desulfuromonas sp. TF]|uniref:peptidyl-prolyl cis-trans isomerase n=1 Tax=Desulfuromonas sp. TF TaxID=1232410 RepID=UPI000428F084|nr:peptidyl-prolyl cis-trans isomerase [Desulfuromonas sp. TF]